MKRTLAFSTLFLFFALVLVSCQDDFLERRPDDQIDAEQVFTRYVKANQLVTDLYAQVKAANRPLVYFVHFSTAPATDECEGSTVEGGITNKFNSGDWGPNAMPDRSDGGQYWNGLYSKIRQTNVFLEGVRTYKTPDNPLQEGDLDRRIGEVYFMRAYLHYLAARMYGEIVYVDRVVQATDPMNFKKESFHAIVGKIARDCDSAYARVPGLWSGTDFGRIDKGACLGLKAMARWMAATPLWNGGTLAGDTRQFKSEYSYNQTRWAQARDAAKAVLDFKADGIPRYSLYVGHDASDFKDDAGVNNNNSKVYARLWDLYHSMDAYQKEGVFFVTRDKDNNWQGDVYPPSSGGSARQMPVQEQVDEYEYIAPNGYGYPVYDSRAKADGYDDENPYESVKRDPRFYRDIVYHGSTFKGKVINTAEGSDRVGATNSTTTGYFLRKILRESWNRDKSFAINGPPVWRLPEFMYIYCEGVNETTGPNAEIADLLNQVRKRSFMAPIAPEAVSNKKLMSEYIQRERRVELFYENNRIWTTRLYLEPSAETELAKEQNWQSAGSTNDERSQKAWPYPKTQRMVNGMRPVEDPNGKIVIGTKKYKMRRFFIENRVFLAPRHYLFPIMQSELQRTPTLLQNPGW
ncbi:RagB/SusD family nutrient uptake outer membrane protein [Rudanella paleaurantiibacter]|uniref:RagB/SusD family nutrient uptake outer membrane protein n=1 Tax=Rudanella paleaurantiibacter TaxID=2614655 RepID=A0A7J5U433_9BACT|nr:RagB/SusD family nutrient uptake outer membrane protein [Rudanella paleaurantiibacter]KAB7731795.1 RagB/SusD family nutrient uptake outer membrane protein [Rudanella paleaurantiibacter]